MEKMRKVILLGLLIPSLLIPVSCSSASGNMPVQLIPPRFRVRQLAGQVAPSAYRDTTNVNLLIDVYNDSAEPIVLKRIRLKSQSGNLQIQPTGRYYNETVPPHDVRTVDIWVRAYLDNVFGSENEPIQVRGTATFTSEYGSFTRLFIEPVIVHDSRNEPR